MTPRTLPIVLLLLAACGGGGTGNTDTGTGITPRSCASTFLNPLGSGADPWVTRVDGTYYMVESRDGGIFVYRSDTLTAPRKNAAQVWRPTGSGWNQVDIWAPELHRIGDRWYIYYAAGRPGPTGPDAAFTDQRSGVLESVTSDAQGAYVDKGMLYTGDDIATGADPKWAIDLNTAVINGQRYATWSGWETNAPTHITSQHTYIARMSDPVTISSNRVRISSPVEEWERGPRLALQEGQTFLQHGTDTFILYSTRESFLPDYRLGWLRLAAPTADPMLPASWTKSAGPVFTGVPSAGVYGVGHSSYTTSPDGTESWIVFHAKSRNDEGWGDRVIRMQRFTWNADGTPSFGTPVSNATPVRVPAGQCAPAAP